MAKANYRPRTEIVWVLDTAGRPTIRTARRLVYKGRAATDPETARVAMALAHKAEAEALGPVGAVFVGMMAAVMLALGLSHANLVGGLPSRIACCGLGAFLLAMIPWQIRLSQITAPRAELANRTFLKSAGAAYQPIGETASIRLAPIGLLVMAVSWLVPTGLGLGLVIANIAHRPSAGLATIIAAGAPAAIGPAVTAGLKSRHAWKPAPAGGGRRLLGRRADRRA